MSLSAAMRSRLCSQSLKMGKCLALKKLPQEHLATTIQSRSVRRNVSFFISRRKICERSSTATVLRSRKRVMSISKLIASITKTWRSIVQSSASKTILQWKPPRKIEYCPIKKIHLNNNAFKSIQPSNQQIS